MRTTRVLTTSLLALVSSLTFDVSVATERGADELDNVEIMALGPLDGRAVIKTADNKMHVLKLGSGIPGTKATVTQMLSDKLVVEDADGVDGAGPAQTVWLTKSGLDGKVTVQRLQKEAPPQESQQLEASQFVEMKDLKTNSSAFRSCRDC